MVVLKETPGSEKKIDPGRTAATRPAQGSGRPPGARALDRRPSPRAVPESPSAERAGRSQPPGARRLLPLVRPPPVPRPQAPTSRSTSPSSAPAPAATPPPSAPPTSGLKVALIERYPELGGVCLNVGCIPSKALLHTARVVEEAAFLAQHGVAFGKPSFDLDEAPRLQGGRRQTADRRPRARSPSAARSRWSKGSARFSSDRTFAVEAPGGKTVTVGLRPRDPRRRLAGRRDSRHSLRRPARPRLDLARSSCERSAAAPGDRRRHHRSRDGDGLRGARVGS